MQQSIALAGVDEEDWPPCMRRIVADLANGVNVNHFGRVFLASMGSTMELPQTTTVDFFRGAPDFSEATTTYQVGHVYEQGYTPAGCAKLKVNHNCPVLPGDDRLCDREWLTHPLKYVRSNSAGSSAWKRNQPRWCSRRAAANRRLMRGMYRGAKFVPADMIRHRS